MSRYNELDQTFPLSTANGLLSNSARCPKTQIHGEYTIELLESNCALAALKDDWVDLYSRAQARSAFMSWDWNQAWRAYLCPTSSFFLLTARHGDELVGLMPLRLQNSGPFRVLRFLADGRADYLGFLLAPNHAAAGGALIEGLARYKDAWDVAILRHWNDAILRPDSLPIPASLGRLYATTRMAPYLTIEGEWAQLLKSAPTELRKSERKDRKFRRNGGTVERLVGDQLAGVVECISSIESRSWKAGNSAARYQEQPEQDMLRSLLEHGQLRSEIEVWLAHFDGQPVAFLLNFVSRERTCYYQGAYDQAYSQYSPGGVLHYHAIKRANSESSHEYDFMMGDEPWKSRWSNHERALRELVLYRKSIRGALAFIFLAAPKSYGRGILKRISSSIAKLHRR